jgi:hypothetical protein
LYAADFDEINEKIKINNRFVDTIVLNLITHCCETGYDSDCASILTLPFLLFEKIHSPLYYLYLSWHY